MRYLFEYTPGMDIASLGGTFTRGGTVGSYYNRQGFLAIASADVLRDDHWIDGVRTTLLERTKVNLITESENFGAWNISDCNRTAGFRDPKGTLTAYKLEDPTVGGDGGISLPVAFSDGNGTKVASVFMRSGTSAQSRLGILDSTVGSWRHLIRVTWNNGVPTVSDEVGTGNAWIDVLRDGWYRIMFQAPGVIVANTNHFFIYASGSGATGTVHAFGAQAENAEFPSSYIPSTGGATTRGEETLAFSDASSYPWQLDDLTMHFEFFGGYQVSYNQLIALGHEVAGGAELGTLELYSDAAQFRAEIRPVSASINNANRGDASGWNSRKYLTAQFKDFDTVSPAVRLFSAADDVGSSWNAVSGRIFGLTGAPPRVKIGHGSNGTGHRVPVIAFRIAAGLESPADMRLPWSYVRFADSDGTAFLQNEKPGQAARFSNWTPDHIPIGDSAATLADESVYMFQTSKRYSATFEMPFVRSKFRDSAALNTTAQRDPVEVAERLKFHLMNGGRCLVQTGDKELTSFGPCGLRPGSIPQVTLVDRRTVEYMFSANVINLKTAPARMFARYGE